MKKTLLYIGITIALVALIAVSLNKLSVAFMDVSISGTSAYSAHSLYAQPKDSVDVLLLGSSRTYLNTTPAVMWSEYGISAYSFATAAQPLNLTYYALKEALKVQTPKVVVCEVGVVLPEEKKNDQLEIMSLQSGMKYSVNQTEMLTDKFDPEHFGEYFLRFPCFHKNYDALRKASFTKMDYACFPVSHAAGFKGNLQDSFFAIPQPLPEPGTVAEDPAAEERYASLEKIYRLCQKKNIPLVLMLTPSVEYAELAAAVQFSQDHQVDYINFMNLLNEIGFDANTDMMDGSHCNYYGAAKVSRYLSEHLMKYYGIVSHAGDVAYRSWDEYVTYLDLLENNYYLSEETGLGNYFNYIPNDNYLIIASLRGNYHTSDQGQLNVLKKLGCNDAAYQMGCTWVMDGTNLLYCYIPGQDSTGWTADIAGSSFAIRRAPGDDPHATDIFIDGNRFEIVNEESDAVENGIELIVYDKLSQKLADAVIFDAMREYAIVRNPK